MTAAAFNDSKAAFVARRAHQFRRLHIAVEASGAPRGLKLLAAFMPAAQLDWEQVDVFVSAADLAPDAGVAARMHDAFARLDDRIATIELARRFAPLGYAGRDT